MESVLIGLARTGRTTIFNALTGQDMAVGDASLARRQPYLSEVKVPDDRLDKLAALFHPRKLTHAAVLFKDPQLDQDDKGNISATSLAEVRKADAIAVVVRAFVSEGVEPAFPGATPLGELRRILDSLVFGDLEISEKRLARLDKEAKRDTREYKVLQQIVATLGTGKPLGAGFLTSEDLRLFAGFGFLTTKPLFVVVNTGEKALPHEDLVKEAAAQGIHVFPIRGDMEMEISRLSPEDQLAFLQDLGLEEPARNRFLRHVYSTLNLVSFFTVGDDECKAWSIRQGTNAVGAAGEIHTDLAKGFIRAEVAAWQDVVEYGDLTKAKKGNKVRLEGKDYVVRDGDVVLIRFNV
ncbi:MAG TPA: DUF933 domain-containing protein [Spirochaetia bacterium]|nr:DUF933 domain-containing protein [Spirochaetia bacterium]